MKPIRAFIGAAVLLASGVAFSQEQTGRPYVNVLNYGLRPEARTTYRTSHRLWRRWGRRLGLALVAVMRWRSPCHWTKYTDYYFSDSFEVTRGMSINCGSPASDGGDASTRLIFAPGVDGVVYESGSVSADGGWGAGDIRNCAIFSLGHGQGATTPSSNTITGVTMVNVNDAGIPVSTWSIGDGIVAISKFVPTNSLPAVPAGAYVSNVSGSTLTLAPGFGTFAAIGSSNNVEVFQLPVSRKYTIKVL